MGGGAGQGAGGRPATQAEESFAEGPEMLSANRLFAFALSAAAVVATLAGPTPIPGVHVPMPIAPNGDIADNVWLTYFYPLVLR